VISSEDLLRKFIHPMQPRDFMSTIWQKRAFVSHGSVSRLEHVVGELYDLDVEQLVENSMSDTIKASAAACMYQMRVLCIPPPPACTRTRTSPPARIAVRC
jgi:hypothetical protein